MKVHYNILEQRATGSNCCSCFPSNCDCVLQNELSKYLYESLLKVPNVRIYGPLPGPKGDGRASLCSFNVEGIHATDLSSFLDQQV